MSETLPALQGGAVVVPALLESILLMGDLSKLPPTQRLQYYSAVCDSLGLNNLTKPFDYINLNGKLTLYATKNCTDQLRARDAISIQIVSRELIDDIYVVTARASNPGGRVDESTGSVSIAGLKGEAKANAYMKAETKSKRRVTLSLCGLGMLDESEVDSIPNAQRIPVDEAGEIQQPKKTAGKFDILKEFSKMKKAIGDTDYYRILKAVGGVNKSDQFKDTDESRAKARKTWASMEAFRREVVARVGQMADEGAVPSFDEWPEGFDGPALRVKGILYKLDSGGYVRMQDLGVSEADMPAEVEA